MSPLKHVLMWLSVTLACMAAMQGNWLLMTYWALVYGYWLINYLEGKK